MNLVIDTARAAELARFRAGLLGRADRVRGMTEVDAWASGAALRWEPRRPIRIRTGQDLFQSSRVPMSPGRVAGIEIWLFTNIAAVVPRVWVGHFLRPIRPEEAGPMGLRRVFVTILGTAGLVAGGFAADTPASADVQLDVWLSYPSLASCHLVLGLAGSGHCVRFDTGAVEGLLSSSDETHQDICIEVPKPAPDAQVVEAINEDRSGSGELDDYSSSCDIPDRQDVVPQGQDVVLSHPVDANLTLCWDAWNAANATPQQELNSKGKLCDLLIGDSR